MGNQYPSTFPGYNQSSRPRPIPRDTRTNRHNVQRQQVPQHAAISLVPEGWRNWAEVTVKINGLPPDAQTIDVFHMCKDEGNIIRINLFEDRRGERTGDAEVTVSPPPDQPFWESAEWCIEAKDKWARTWTFTPRFSLKEPTRNFMHPSPINPHRKFPENFVKPPPLDNQKFNSSKRSHPYLGPESCLSRIRFYVRGRNHDGHAYNRGTQ